MGGFRQPERQPEFSMNASVSVVCYKSKVLSNGKSPLMLRIYKDNKRKTISYHIFANLCKQGKTIIVVSSEMPEILGITNRIGVMSNGHLAGIVNTKETNQEELLRLSAKYL